MVKKTSKMNLPQVLSWWIPVLDHCRNQEYLTHRIIPQVKVSQMTMMLEDNFKIEENTLF